jgi:hypothetical protein
MRITKESIEAYLKPDGEERFTNSKTRQAYRCNLMKFENVKLKDQDLISKKDDLKKTYKPATLNKTLSILNEYLKYNKIKLKLFEAHRLNQENEVKEEAYKRTNESTETFESLKEKFNSFQFENTDDKIVLGAFLYKMTPRSDIINYRCDCKNESGYVSFKRKKIVVPKCLKTEKKIAYPIPSELWELVKTKKGDQYLIYNDVKSESSRKELVWKKIKELTIKIYGKHITVNELRRAYENSGDGLTTAKALNNGHTFETAQIQYKRNPEKVVTVYVDGYKITGINVTVTKL